MPATDSVRPGASIELQLFGWWNLRVHDQQVLLCRREQAVVAFLALRGCRPRSHIAGILWPNATEERALTSLRAAVLRTRRTVAGLLEVRRTTLGLHPDVHVDVDEVHRVAGEVARRPDHAPHHALGVLAGDDLLPGWYDDWVLVERERLRNLRLSALETLAQRALARGDTELGASAARMATLIEPLRERAHALVVRAHLIAGNRPEAIRQFSAYRRLLREELAIAPSAQFTQLLYPDHTIREPSSATASGTWPGRW